MASRIRSWRNRSRSPSSSSTRALTASASATDSSSAERPATVARSVRVKLVPRIEAARSACRVSPGRKLIRRKMVSRSDGGRAIAAASARPPEVLIASSWASAASSSVTNSGLPAAPGDPGQQPRAGHGGDRLGHQVGHGLLGEAAQDQLPGPGGRQRAG